MNRPIRAFLVRGLGWAMMGFVSFHAAAAQQGSVISMTGTYDLDQDGLSEFLALETTQSGQTEPDRVSYKEIEPDGSHTELWQFAAGHPIRDARIADTNGDGTAEVVVMEFPEPRPGTTREPWLHLFSWKNGRFPSEPDISWGSNPEDRQMALRPSHFAVLDIENDGKDELAVALSSPRREVLILTSSSRNPEFSVRRLSLSDQIASGYGHILLVAGDQNQDGFTDLLVLNNELNRIEIQVFEGTGSELRPGPYYDQSTQDIRPPISGILPSSLYRVDSNRDGDEELLIPSRGGPTLAVVLQDGVLRLSHTAPELSALFSFPLEGIQPGHLNDILLARAELGITGRKIRQLKMLPQGVPSGETVTPEVSSAPPDDEEPPPAPPGRRVRRLELEAMEKEEEPSTLTGIPPAEAVVPVDTGFAPSPEEEKIEPSGPRRVRELALESVTREEVPAPPSAEVMEIPAGIDISDTVLTGQTYSHSLVLSEGEDLYAFRPKELPAGATFDPATRTITWTPTTAQVGLHTLAYDLEYELAGKPAVEETGATVQVVTKTETRSVELFLIVLGAQAE